MILSSVIYEYKSWKIFRKYDISNPRFTLYCRTHGDEWVSYQRVKEQARSRRDYARNRAVESVVYVALVGLWLLPL